MATTKATSPKRGYYLLKTDGAMANPTGKRKRGDPSEEASIGAVLMQPSGAIIATISRRIAKASHNLAEYRALIEGLELARQHSVSRIRVYMDSEVVVNQITKQAQVGAALAEAHEEALGLYETFSDRRISWIPREWNKEADALASHALLGGQ